MLLLLLLAAATMTSAAPAPARPPLIKTFSAHSWSHNYASGSFNQTVIGPVVVDATRLSVSQESPLADGRSTRVVLDYATDVVHGGVWSLQPFFDEHVCYIYPLPAGGPASPHETFDEALSEIWCPQGQEANIPCMPSYEKSTYEGEGEIDGQACSLWGVHEDKPPVTVEDIVFCVTKAGALLSVNLTFHGQQTLRYGNPPENHVFNTTAISHNVFSNLSVAPPASAFVVPTKGCVDLRPISNVSDDGDQQVNHPERLAKLDEAARAAGWRAGPNANFEDMTVAEASASLGLKLGLDREERPWSLPLVDQAHRMARGEVEGAVAPPASFDARDKWGKECASIGAVRNQGACGSCWAFAAAETLADRLCIGSNGKAPYNGPMKLSTEYLIDCDHHDHGCSGGMLDDAWFFLRDTGLPVEECDPYQHCPHPAVSSCKAPAPPPGGHCEFTNHSTIDASPMLTFGCDNAAECCGQCQQNTKPLCVVSAYHSGLCSLYNTTATKPMQGATMCKPIAAPPPLPPPPAPKPTCPTVCAKAGEPLTLHKASNAYSVGMPGDVVSIQRELMTHGPIEVGFTVFSDFMSYRNGTYSRTAGAQMRGGHAVKLTGWGVDVKGVDYWVIANSWSPEFGIKGFFHIRRGTNECGVETTPAAGLPQLGGEQ